MGLVCLASASSLKKYSKDFVVYLAWKSCQCGTFMLKQYSCLSVTGQIYTKTNSEGEREREGGEERGKERLMLMPKHKGQQENIYSNIILHNSIWSYLITPPFNDLRFINCFLLTQPGRQFIYCNMIGKE
jgi:hypothetical protein